MTKLETKPQFATYQASKQSRLTVSLAAIRHNWQTVSSITKVPVLPVLKADAYGCGAVKIAQYLHENGAKGCFVATLDEAITLRQAVPQAWQIFVLNGFNEAELAAYEHYQLIPIVNDLKQWHACSLATVPFVLHVDTGMNRLGLPLQDIDKGPKDSHAIIWLMSHLAAADADHPFNQQQAQNFKLMRQRFSGVPTMLANTYACFRGQLQGQNWPAPKDDLICEGARIGIGLYGAHHTGDFINYQQQKNENPLRLAVKLTAQILQIREAKAGATVGYGAANKLINDTKVATVALGYADACLRALSPDAYVIINGNKHRFLGPISMDSCGVDLSPIACEHNHKQTENNAEIKVGDWVEFIGSNRDLDTAAAQHLTIPHEILTSIGNRVERVYE